jgi:hypothetical protein
MKTNLSRRSAKYRAVAGVDTFLQARGRGVSTIACRAARGSILPGPRSGQIPGGTSLVAALFCGAV